ncbi:MAG: D-alanine--D-alanine ligase [Oscillospiraceae bacterium]|nr:D-alanine--D-alanine ligase [Oscillospiraceae bacterium]
MKRTRVAVIFGGQSSEYEVSLMSASSVLRNLDRDRYEVITLGINKKGRWLLYNGSIDRIKNKRWEQPGFVRDAFISPSTNSCAIIAMREDNRFTEIQIDVVFPVLHGKNGEDGTIQGLLELAGIPYVGCDTLSSAICMDKIVAHSVLKDAGIKTADWIGVIGKDTKNPELCDRLIRQKFGYPVFVKPANAGSSVGISKVKKPGELGAALDKALLTDGRIIIEQGITGIELECAVLGNGEPLASDVGEIAPLAEFYDYDAKYIDGGTGLFVPARVEEKTRKKIGEIAVKAYRVMACTGLARVDFFLQPDGAIVLNELNTLPGFTHISMYPRLFEAAGLPYKNLLDRLIELAFEKKAGA